MRCFLATLAVLLIVCAADSPLHSQSAGILLHPGIGSVEVLRALDNLQNADAAGVARGMYVMGFLAGLTLAPMFDEPDTITEPPRLTRWTDCMRPMSVGQIGAIIQKYVADNPAMWHEQLNIVTFRALREVCEK